MLRLRLFLCLLTSLYLANAIMILSCSEDPPQSPTSETTELMNKSPIVPLGERIGGVPTEWYVTTSAQLDSVLCDTLNPVLVSGDTIRLKASEVFDLGTKYYSELDLLELLVIGDTPKPTIKSTRSTGSQSVLDILGPTQLGRIEFRNFKIDCSSGSINAPFIRAVRYAAVVFDEVEGILGERILFLDADSVRASNCELNAYSPCFNMSNWADESVFLFDQLTLHSTKPTGPASLIWTTFGNVSGSVIIKNSVFSGATTGSRDYLKCNSYTTDSSTVNVRIEDNSILSELVAYLGGLEGQSAGVDYEINFVRNTLLTGVCPVFEDNGEVEVTFDSLTWKWNGYTVDFDYLYADIGEVENVAHTKKYCDSKDYVVASFDLVADTADEFHHYMAPTVKFGLDGAPLSNNAAVCWNPSTNKWLAEMDISGLTNCGAKVCSLQWYASVTFCDSIGTSDTQSYGFTWGAGVCKDPLLCD